MTDVKATGKLKNITENFKNVLISDLEADKKKYYFSCLELPIDERTVFYECLGGLGILGDQRAVFKAMIRVSKKQPEFNRMTHIFSVKNKELADYNLEEFKGIKNLLIVEKGSRVYYRHLATAKYLFMDNQTEDILAKRDEQIFINSGTGIPIKNSGFEYMLDRTKEGNTVLRSMLNSDFMLCANNYMKDRIYKKAYLGDGMYAGEFLKIGMPRFDAISKTARPYILKRLEGLGFDPSKKIILYAPTWRGDKRENISYSITELMGRIKKMRRNVPKDYEVYLRVHPLVYKEIYRDIAEDEELREMVIPQTIDTSELLSVTDVLITDFSSITMDFVKTGRPILFYAEDMSEYIKDRGLLLPLECLPGAFAESIEDLCYILKATLDNLDDYNIFYKEKYLRMKWWTGPACEDRVIETLLKNRDIPDEETINNAANDGGNSIRFIKKIFTDNIRSKIHHDETEQDKKAKIVYYISKRDFKIPVLERVKEEIENIDLEKADITILREESDNKAINAYFDTEIPKNIRILLYTNLPYEGDGRSQFIMYDRNRTLGKARFDYIREISKLPVGWSTYSITRK